jgi:hypothetical protein
VGHDVDLALPTAANICAPVLLLLLLLLLLLNSFSTDVVGVGHDVDLALLTVEDEAFWQGGEDAGHMKPLQLGDVPQLQVGLGLGLRP